jgi:hypothetical protein
MLALMLSVEATKRSSRSALPEAPVKKSRPRWWRLTRRSERTPPLHAQKRIPPKGED